jgi:hypothetical protein
MALQDPNDNIVRLAIMPNLFEAHALEQALRAQGISCRVVGDYLDPGLGYISEDPAEVWVHQDDLDAAEAILREVQGSKAGSEPEA